MSREHIQNSTRKTFTVDYSAPIDINVPVKTGPNEDDVVLASASETTESIGVTETDTAPSGSGNTLGGAVNVILYGPVKTIKTKATITRGKRVIKDSANPGFFKEAPAALTSGTVKFVFSEGILLEGSTASGGTINEVSMMYSPLWIPVAV